LKDYKSVDRCQGESDERMCQLFAVADLTGQGIFAPSASRLRAFAGGEDESGVRHIDQILWLVDREVD